MTKEEAIVKLKEASKLNTEDAHYTADEILCELLNSLGYQDVTEAYDYIHKWYV